MNITSSDLPAHRYEQWPITTGNSGDPWGRDGAHGTAATLKAIATILAAPFLIIAEVAVTAVIFGSVVLAAMLCVVLPIVVFGGLLELMQTMLGAPG